jgi:hypothetical protein
MSWVIAETGKPWCTLTADLLENSVVEQWFDDKTGECARCGKKVGPDQRAGSSPDVG